MSDTFLKYKSTIETHNCRFPPLGSIVCVCTIEACWLLSRDIFKRHHIGRKETACHREDQPAVTGNQPSAQ